MNRQSIRLGPIKERLAQIERRLQVLVEGSARRLFPGAQISDLLAGRLLEAVRDGLRVEADGQVAAPEQLILFISPGEMELFKNRRWLEELETALRAGGSEAGVCFPAGPFLQVQMDAALGTGEVRVATQNHSSTISGTSDMAAAPDSQSKGLEGAFLIVDGTRLFPLEQPVINIGRRPDNQLVIDDARISRTHAQLRLVHGQYVIFDLDSSGGTWVNGKPIRQQALRPGDVILLSGLPLVYGQESPGPGETQEYVPES
jgi:FHA domain/FhaA, N-terminal domain